MRNVTELDLDFLALESQELANDPLPHFERVRRKHPWLAQSAMGFVITRYRPMAELLGLDSNLRLPAREMVSSMGGDGSSWGQFVQDTMLSRSGEDHHRLRSAVSAAFRPDSVNRIRPLIRSTIDTLLDDWAPKGAFDFGTFAANFPVRVMFAMLGTPIERLDPIIASLEIQGSSFNMENGKFKEIQDSYDVLWTFVDHLVQERRELGNTADRHVDLLDTLLECATLGKLDETELRQMLILLFGAGYDTSKNLLTLLMYSMIKNPEVWARCAQDLSYCKRVVREQLRFTGPSNTYRIVTNAFDYQGVHFPEGTSLFFPLTISGLDPESFDEPLTFTPERAGPSSLAFGRGMHICLGMFLAQANVEEGAHLIAKRLVNPRFSGPVQWRGFPGVWGIKSLPIAFDASVPMH